MLDAVIDRLTDAWRGSPAGGARSPDWPKLRKEWLRACPSCAACGAARKLEVHHLRPVHMAPHLELDRANLLTLCRACHLLVGHLQDWRSWNIDAVTDAAAWREKVRRRPVFVGAPPRA